MKAQRMFSQFRYSFVSGCIPVRPPLSMLYQSEVCAIRSMGIEPPSPYGKRGVVDLFDLPVVDSIRALWILEAA